MMYNYYVYIMASKKYGTLYIGVTNDLINRVSQYKQGTCRGIRNTRSRLVYYENSGYIQDAIVREKQLKNWHRDWKINLIERENLTLDRFIPHVFWRDGSRNEFGMT